MVEEEEGSNNCNLVFGQTMTGIIRMFVFFSLLSKFFGPKKPTEPSQLISNLFQKGESMDMWLYHSEHENFSDFNKEDALIWHETGIAYAIWSPESTKSLSVKYHPSEALRHNGSLYAHVFFARSGYPPDPADPEYQPTAAFGRIHPVVTYLPKSKADTRRRLLSNSKDDQEGETASQEVDDGPVEWISYWKPNITINLVDDFTRTGNYHPTVFFNELWLLKEKLISINESVTELTLNLEVGHISMTKWQLFLQIEKSFQMQRNYGSMLEEGFLGRESLLPGYHNGCYSTSFSIKILGVQE